jgi:hypothetical protein
MRASLAPPLGHSAAAGDIMLFAAGGKIKSDRIGRRDVATAFRGDLLASKNASAIILVKAPLRSAAHRKRREP